MHLWLCRPAQRTANANAGVLHGIELHRFSWTMVQHRPAERKSNILHFPLRITLREILWICWQSSTIRRSSGNLVGNWLTQQSLPERNIVELSYFSVTPHWGVIYHSSAKSPAERSLGGSVWKSRVCYRRFTGIRRLSHRCSQMYLILTGFSKVQDKILPIHSKMYLRYWYMILLKNVSWYWYSIQKYLILSIVDTCINDTAQPWCIRSELLDKGQFCQSFRAILVVEV